MDTPTVRSGYRANRKVSEFQVQGLKRATTYHAGKNFNVSCEGSSEGSAFANMLEYIPAR